MATAAEMASEEHIANEWADMATTAIQWLRNVQDGISTPAEALAEKESNLVRLRSLIASSRKGSSDQLSAERPLLRLTRGCTTPVAGHTTGARPDVRPFNRTTVHYDRSGLPGRTSLPT